MGKTTAKPASSPDKPTFRLADGIMARQMPSIPMDWIDHHPDIEFNYLRRGCITYLLGGRHVVLRQGEVALFWAAQPHQVIAAAGDDLIDWIHVPLQTFLSWGVDQQAVNQLLAGQILGGGGSPETDAPGFERWIRDLNSRRPNCLKAAVLEMHARVCRCMDAGPSWYSDGALKADPVLGSMVYISAHSHQVLSVSSLARQAGLHPDYLSRLFQERFGQSIVQAIIRHRLFRTQTLLLSGNQPITDIAFASGFGSLSQFNKVFREHMGMSPRDFRALHGRKRGKNRPQMRG